MLTLSELHDTTLDRIELSWKSGGAIFHIKTYIDKRDINIEMIIQGLTDLKVPRFYPWGPSVSINKAWQENSGEAIKLVIEMQSGDIIEARAKSYILQQAS